MKRNDEAAVVLGEIGWSMQDAIRVFQTVSIVALLLCVSYPFLTISNSYIIFNHINKSQVARKN